MAEPHLQKKLKVKDNEIQFFEDFLENEKNESLTSILRAILSELKVGLAHSSVFFLRVKASNANSYTDFQKATIDAEVHRRGSVSVAAPIALFYLRGYATLIDFLDTPDAKIREDIVERRALRELLQFLTDTNEHSVFTENRDRGKEGKEWADAVRFAQHLLKLLEFISVDYCPEVKLIDICSGYNEGCSKGWHGRVGILITGKEVPLTVVEDSEDLDVGSCCSDSSAEVKRGEQFSSATLSQIMAQTIVYSFVQCKKNPMSQNSLVPGIGICSEKLIVYLYDCVEDVFLAIGPIDLYAQMGVGVLNIRAVIILWLVLNFDLFGSGIPENYKKHKADFHQVLGSTQLGAYMNESEQPFNAKYTEGDLCKCLAEEVASFEDDLTKYLPERKSILLKTNK